MIQENIYIAGVDVTKYVKQYVQATKLLRLAEQGKDVGYSIEQLKQMKTNALAGVASALSQLVPDPKKRAAASVAFNSYFAAHEVTTLTSTITFGQFLGIVGAVAGAIFALGAIFGLFGDKEKYIQLKWIGDVNIKVNFSPSGISLSCKVIRNVGNVKALQSIMNVVKKYCDEVNSVLKEIPIDDIDFIKRYLPRPHGDVFSVHMEVIVGDDVGSEREARKLIEKFNKLLGQELTKVLTVLRQIAENVSMLVFLKEIGAENAVEIAVINAMPDLGYRVEGMWRKELERLSIKLTRTREYDRQIDHALRAAAISATIDVLLSSPRVNNVGPDRVALKNRIMELVDSNPELRYGFDLIGRQFGIYKTPWKTAKTPKMWRRVGRKDVPAFPPLFLQKSARYILKPVVVDNKLQIKMIQKEKSVFKEYSIRYLKENPRYRPFTLVKFDDFGYYLDVRIGSKKIRCLNDWKEPICRVVESFHEKTILANFSDIIPMRVISFVNYLLSDIPKEAINYIVNHVGSVEIYINYDRLFDAISFDCKGTTVGSPPHYSGAFSSLPGLNPRGLWIFAVVWLLPSAPTFGYRWDEVGVLKNIDSVSCKPLDDESITNMCRALNALVLDIVDVYNFWLKGYAMEWKKRMQTQLLEQALPQLRMQLLPIIRKLATQYSNLPETGIGLGRMEMENYVLSNLDKWYQEIKDYTKYIQANKDFIVSMFGIDEYNRLLQEAMAYQNQLNQQIEDKWSKLTLNDIDQILSIDPSKLTDVEKKAVINVANRMLNELKQIYNNLESTINKYDEAYNKLAQYCGGV